MQGRKNIFQELQAWCPLRKASQKLQPCLMLHFH